MAATLTYLAGPGAHRPAGPAMVPGPGGRAAGHLYPIAGTGTAGFSGDGGPAIHAEAGAASVAVDGQGNLVISDGRRIRLVTG
jgi:hypothetical protein